MQQPHRQRDLSLNSSHHEHQKSPFSLVNLIAVKKSNEVFAEINAQRLVVVLAGATSNLGASTLVVSDNFSRLTAP